MQVVPGMIGNATLWFVSVPRLKRSVWARRLWGGTCNVASVIPTGVLLRHHDAQIALRSAPVLGITATAKERSDGFFLVWSYLVPSP